MRLSELLSPQDFLTGVEATTKEALFDLLVDALVARHPELDARLVLRRLHAREQQASTGIGSAVALPHAMMPEIEDNILLACTLRQPLDYDDEGRGPVRVVFVLLSPADRPGMHIKILARIARLCNESGFVDALSAAPDPAGAYAVLRRFEARC